MSLQSICVGPRMIHKYLTLKSWMLFMYTEVMFLSGDVLPLWDALFSFQRAWHSVPQAVSLGVVLLRTRERMDWFWGDKAQEGGVKRQSPSSNRGLMPFPVFEEQQGWTSSPTGVPQHLRLMAPLQCLPVTPTPLMGGTGFSTVFTMPFAENEWHSKSTPQKDKYQSYLCWNVSVGGHAVPGPAPHLPASALSSSIWCPWGALGIPLPSRTQPLVLLLSHVGPGKLLLHPVTTFSHLTLPFPHQEVLCLSAKNHMNIPSYSAPAVCQVRRKSAQSLIGQGCSRKSFSFLNHLLFLMSSTVVCLTPC